MSVVDLEDKPKEEKAVENAKEVLKQMSSRRLLTEEGSGNAKSDAAAATGGAGAGAGAGASDTTPLL